MVHMPFEICIKDVFQIHFRITITSNRKLENLIVSQSTTIVD